jgi:glycerol kinase
MKNNIKINSLLVDGGMTANKTFCQLLSNTLQKNISKPENIESTALGACLVSQISEGLSIEDVKPRLENIYKPDGSSKNFYKSDYSCWKEYIEITISNIK